MSTPKPPPKPPIGTVITIHNDAGPDAKVFDIKTDSETLASITPQPPPAETPQPEEVHDMTARESLVQRVQIVLNDMYEKPGYGLTDVAEAVLWEIDDALVPAVVTSSPKSVSAPPARTGSPVEQWMVELAEEFNDYVNHWEVIQTVPSLIAIIAKHAPAPSGVPVAVGDGASLIAAERLRQVAEEKWDAGHDNEHEEFELTQAAISYARYVFDTGFAHTTWPWTGEQWKPSRNPVRNLVKAGALIAAEIDRLQRLTKDTKGAA